MNCFIMIYYYNILVPHHCPHRHVIRTAIDGEK